MDALVGTAGNDTFVGTLDAAAGASTINVGDSVDGAGGTDTFKLSSNVAAASNNNTGLTLKNIENVEISNLVAGGANLHTFNAANASGVQEVAVTGIGDVTVTNIGTAALGIRGFVSNNAAAQTVTAAGANTVNLGGVSVGTTTPASTLDVDISGGAGASAQAVVVNSTGAANTISDLKIGNTTPGAASLTINADTNFKTSSVTEAVTNSLKTVTAAGKATTVDIGTIGSTALTGVDASGLTAGGIKVGIGANVATTFKGGAGNDTVTIAAGAVMTGALDGGAGTADTLALSTGASLTAATGKLFTNFEVLQGSNAGAVGTTETYDSSLISGITAYKVAASIGAVALTNLVANATVTVTGAVAGTAGLAATLKDATGSADVINVVFDNGSTATTGNVNGASVTTLTSVGTETLNITSGGKVLGTGTANTVALDPANTSLSKVVVTGDQLFSLTTGAIAKNLTVDGSTATGKLTLDASGAAAGAVQVNLNGGSANDTILATNVATSNGTIYGGKGGDAVTLGAGTDTVVFKAASDSTWDMTGVAGVGGSGTMDAYANFTSGTDKIDLTSFNIGSAALKQVVVKTFASVAAINTAASTADFYLDGASIARGAVLATDGTDGYLFVDANQDGVFTAADDLAIKLTGVDTVAQGDLIWG